MTAKLCYPLEGGDFVTILIFRWVLAVVVSLVSLFINSMALLQAIDNVDIIHLGNDLCDKHF